MGVLGCGLFVLIFIATRTHCDRYETTNIRIYNEAEFGNRIDLEKLIVSRQEMDPLYVNQDDNNNTALHAAAKEGHEDIVYMLLINGWNVDALNKKSNTPLHFAAEKGYPAIVDLLIRKGANPNVPNFQGFTPFSLAAAKDRPSNTISKFGRVMEVLIDRGANIASSDIEKCSEQMSNFLKQTQTKRDEAFQRIDSSREEHLSPEIKKAMLDGETGLVSWLIRTFKEYIVDEKEGNNLLNFAIEKGKIEIVKSMLILGVNATLANDEGITAVHIAAQYGHEKIIDLLYRKGANCDAKVIATGDKPIHYAVANGHWKCLYKLMLIGSDASSQNNDGLTPLHIAIQKIESFESKSDFSYSNYMKVIEVLLQSNANRHIKNKNGESPLDLIHDNEILQMFRRIRSVAKKECAKYEETVYSSKSDARQKRTAYGVPATSAEFPWIAAVGSKNYGPETPHFFCGGTILSKYYVLTAAHCIERYVQMVVRLGTEFVRKEPTPGQDYYVEKVLRHGYHVETRRNYFRGNRNDIALLKLEKPIKFTNVIGPACLNLARQEENPDVKLTVAGWGTTENGTLSDRLLKTTLITMDNVTQCANYFSHRTVYESQYCAYDPEFKGDACHGDSGGPLQHFESGTSMATVVGVVSYGIAKCPSKAPDLYTKVGYYLDWIQSHVWPAETPMKYIDDVNFNNLDSGVNSISVAVPKGTGMRLFLEKTIDLGI